jgi:hypothetical protein
MARSDAYINVTCDKCGYLEEVELTAIARKGWDERNVKSSLKNHGWFCGDDQEVCESCHDNDEPVQP